MACDAASSLDAYASASLDAEQLHALTNLTSLLPGKQQSPPDRELVWRALKTRCKEGARFLVFGRGMDSDFWAHTMNANGLTVFLEATPAWATGDPTLTTQSGQVPHRAIETVEYCAVEAGHAVSSKPDEPPSYRWRAAWPV